MCTVTYLPKTNSSYFLTHNRDENFTRSIAMHPIKKTVHGIEILTPTDSKAGGTWFASSNDFSLCLLNGGFEKHIPSPPYRHSRGKVILDFFEFNHIDNFHSNYLIHQLEPFTLIIIQNSPKLVVELVNDGQEFYKKNYDSLSPQIWSSSTLYSSEQTQSRKKYFKEFIDKNQFSQEAIINFHTNQFDHYNKEDILINRNGIVQTVSLTALRREEKIDMKYIDFLEHKTTHIEL